MGRLLFFCGLLVVGCSNASSPPEEKAPVDKSTEESTQEAKVLLVRYVDVINALVQNADIDAAPPALDELDARAEALFAKGKLTGEFDARYRRLVNISRLTVVAATDDADKQIEAFVKEVQGPSHSYDRTGGLSAVGPSLAKEVVNLHLLLEPDSDRAKLRAKYFPDRP